MVKLLQLVERDPGAGLRLAYEQADTVIGSVSERTITRHLGRVRRLIAASVLEAASELLAELTPFAALAEVRAGGGGLAELHRYLMALAIARRRAVGRGAAGGSSAACICATWWCAPAIPRHYHWIRSYGTGSGSIPVEQFHAWRHQRGCDTGFSLPGGSTGRAPAFDTTDSARGGATGTPARLATGAVPAPRRRRARLVQALAHATGRLAPPAC